MAIVAVFVVAEPGTQDGGGAVANVRVPPGAFGDPIFETHDDEDSGIGADANAKRPDAPALTDEQLEKCRKIYFAIQNFRDSYNVYALPDRMVRFGKTISSGLSWRVLVLPYLEEFELYEKFRLDEPWDSPHNRPLADQMPDVYRFDGLDLPAGHTTVQYVVGDGTIWTDADVIERGPNDRDILDGVNNTIACVIAGPESAVAWTKPGDLPYTPGRGPSLLGSPVVSVGDQVGWPAIFFGNDVRQRLLPRDTDSALFDRLVQHKDADPRPNPLPPLEVILPPEKQKEKDAATLAKAREFDITGLGLEKITTPTFDVDQLSFSDTLAMIAMSEGSYSQVFERIQAVRPYYPAIYMTTPDQEAEFASLLGTQPVPEGEKATAGVDRRPMIQTLILAMKQLGRPTSDDHRRIMMILESGSSMSVLDETVFHSVAAEWREYLVENYVEDIANTPNGPLAMVDLVMRADGDRGAAIRRIEDTIFGPLAIGQPGSAQLLSALKRQDAAFAIPSETELAKAWSTARGEGDLSDPNTAGGRRIRKRRLQQIVSAIGEYEWQTQAFPRPDGHLAGRGQPVVGEGLSWRVHILPFLGEEELYRRFDLSKPWDAPENQRLVSEMPNVFHQLFDVPVGHTTVQYLTGDGTVWEDQPASMSSLVDGGRTLAVVVVDPSKAVPWTKPADAPFNADNPQSGLGPANFQARPNERGWLFATFDLSIFALPESAPAESVRLLVGPRDRKPTPDDVFVWQDTD